MQLLGADPSGEGRPGTSLAEGSVFRRGRFRRLSRRGSRVRLRRREAASNQRPALPAPLLTPPLAIPNPLRDSPSGPIESGFDTVAFGAGRIPWPRTAKQDEGTLVPESGADDPEDTAEWEQPVPLAIDLSDGPKLIRRPLPPLPVPEKPAAPVVPQAEIVTQPIVGLKPGVDLHPAPPAPTSEPRRVPEALLTAVLSMIASASAWAIAASPQVWLTLSALPAAGLLALILPGGQTARVLRSAILFSAAASLPILDPAMTPVSLVITLATAASYPLLLSPTAGWVVTALAIASPAAALIGRVMADGPERVARLLLNPQAHPSMGIQIALASGILVTALVGITSTTARRRLAGAATAAQAGELRARAETAAVLASATVDPATGLPNREGLLRAVAVALTGPDPVTWGSSQQPVGLVLADLDRFDDLADDLGAQVAGDLAGQTGRRIAEAFADHLVARVSRHQFAVLLTEDVLAPNTDTCADVARRITQLMREPALVGGREFTLSCSLGGAVCGPGLITAEDLLQGADEAVRISQRGGRGRWTMFDRAVRARTRQQAGLENELRQAVARSQIGVDFQPMLALGTSLEDDDHICGAEALPRWRRSDGTTVPAPGFVALADELGLGVTLGLQTINRALAALVIWRHEGVGVDQVWVSLSPAQLEDPDFAHEVAAQLAIRGLTASSLTLQISAGELTESGQALITLGMLRSLGISVALSDFGGGGTSLTMLRRLPITAVKLDGRLAGDLGQADDVPRALAQLGHSLGLNVICGSVASSAQLEGARRIGADAVQGHAIARPMSAQDVTSLLTLRMARDLRLRTRR
ncbi:GGDEF and EAL domain-containing protein [Kineosporia babensis]|uniref:GGDEF and EAL domain-containing protein n=1 Tax=Kineosporia babensis TaxID=499548 RepID=A0A9X1SVR3_9ACTN|nr:GGDEF and EAL domain-containing protein [Kineosporia babensis]MCD5313150.1 GGDEF and EAL domain-containing protein [Kineosporia babensis]